MTTQALRFAIATDIHQDIMHDGPQRLQTFLDVLLDQMDAASVVAEVLACAKGTPVVGVSLI